MRVQRRDDTGAVRGGIEVLQFRIHGDEFLADDFPRWMFRPRAVEQLPAVLGDLRSAGRVRGELEILGSSTAEHPSVVDHELDPPEPKN